MGVLFCLFCVVLFFSLHVFTQLFHVCFTFSGLFFFVWFFFATCNTVIGTAKDKSKEGVGEIL